MKVSRQQIEGLAGFRAALRQFLAASEVISRDAGVTPQQYQAMLAIEARRGGEMTVSDLAEHMQLAHNGAVQLIDRMVKAGFVERQPSTVDRRAVKISLTRAGRPLLRRLAADHLVEMLRQEPLLAESLRRLRRLPRPVAPPRGRSAG
jgi:DNA-binding MarR family transcriptional regulator